MRLQVQLVHAGSGVRVVLVSAWSGGECLGSALGEAAEAEEAERRAEQRLRQRLAAASPLSVEDAPDSSAGSSGQAALIRHRPPFDRDPATGPGRASPQALPLSPPLPAPADEASPQPLGSRSPASSGPDVPMAAPQSPLPSAPDQSSATGERSSDPSVLPATAATLRPEASGEPAPDPEDWSDDLARIDLQVQRLGWDRQQEALYLERAFGHPSRSRLTRYGDLMAYLQALSALEAGADPTRVALPLHRRDLLEQCDELLGRLGWDPDQGRLFLELNFQCSSRQHLSDQQLLQFNMLLEEQWIGQSGPATP
ncbi:MAG: hypothetical protein ACKOCM_03995 [Cyanobacteriota bacterium]